MGRVVCRLAATIGGADPLWWLVTAPIHLVQCGLDELDSLEAKDVLRQRDAVALGSGSLKPDDGRALHDSYLRRATDTGAPSGSADGGLSQSALDWIGWSGDTETPVD